ncbi:phage portal family protein [Flavobacterium hibernum]|uniref:Phage portal protein n=1 Tax=Flavobacterium hibernum TaxID=37752 RepID=A0A0D0EJD0_9FLAO|nr:hypothetical protein [Flavobacterium hibernum]KIO50950.1 hypothetical protein IW18_20395 [Flavobacterium hibernum]OXA85191.1 hypothetical protein B0A73_17735 [Flavobacterium hibernum]STO19569.1 phage portal protein, HK97 family [Flavobacterium hibernum]
MKIKLVDVDNRLSIKYSKQDDVYAWGADNAYPSLVKTLVNSSVTAKQCVDLNSKYIYGKGFEFTQNVTNKNSLIVNRRGLNINQLLRIVSREFSEQNNVFLHVNYNALYEVTSVDLLSSEDLRIGRADSTGYSGKFVDYDNWDKSKSKKIEKKDFNIIDRYNALPAIIEAQVQAAGGWNKYKGQILHITADFNELYSLSDVDSVLYDADSEYQASVFKNSGLRKGFFGAKLFVTKPFTDDMERRDFEKTINDLKGSENSSGVLLLESNEASDTLSEQFVIQNIDSNIDDKQFESSEQSSARNIRKAFGVPSILIEDGDNSIFGQSGELLKEAKKTHWENKEEERSIITDAFELLFSNFHATINPTNNWKITPIIQTIQSTNE